MKNDPFKKNLIKNLGNKFKHILYTILKNVNENREYNGKSFSRP